MDNNKGNTKPKIPLTDLFRAMEESAKLNKVKNPEKELTLEELPALTETMRQLYSVGTMLEVKYPEKEIIFSNPLSPIKSLQVNISSTESRNQQILHKLHSMTRATS